MVISKQGKSWRRRWGRSEDKGVRKKKYPSLMDGNSADPARIAEAVRKMNEDPLFMIKKEEAKHKKTLIDNPLIREKVREMLKAEMGVRSSSSTLTRVESRDFSNRASVRDSRTEHDEPTLYRARHRERSRSRSRRLSPRPSREYPYRDRHRRRSRSGSRDRRPQRYVSDDNSNRGSYRR